MTGQLARLDGTWPGRGIRAAVAEPRRALSRDREAVAGLRDLTERRRRDTRLREDAKPRGVPRLSTLMSNTPSAP